MKTVLRATIAGALLCAAGAALGAPVTYDITGVITSATTAGAVGDTITGAITIDLANGESNWGNLSGVANSANYNIGTEGFGDVTRYQPNVAPVYTLSLSGGGLTYQTLSPSSTDAFTQSFVQVTGGGTTFATEEVDYVTNNYSAYDYSVLNATGISEDSNGVFASKTGDTFTGEFTVRTNGGPVTDVNFQVTNFDLAASPDGGALPLAASSSVPAPFGASLLLVGFAGLAGRRKRLAA